jgi:hypothetical protein
MTDNEKRLGPIFDEAMKLRDAGELLAARGLLMTLVKLLTPQDKTLLPHAHVQLGAICKRLGRHVQRESHFRAASDIAPRLELASVGLFLALVHRGRLNEALYEMVRFVRLRYSELYDEMLTPRLDLRVDAAQQALITEAQLLLARRRLN